MIKLILKGMVMGVANIIPGVSGGTMAVSMGIPKESAIKAATINPARSIGIDGIVGSLEAGKKADILFVDGSLNLQKVMLQGKIIE